MRMKMVKNQGVKQKQKMSRRTVLIIATASSSIVLIIVALLFLFNVGNIRKSFAATGNPVLNTRWVTLTNNGTILKLRLQIQCTTAGHKMNSGDFYCAYDPANMSFSSFVWADNFDPAKNTSNYHGSKVVDFGTGTGFDNSSFNEMDISIVSVNTGTGVTIPDNSWMDVVDVILSVTNPNGAATVLLNPTKNENTLTDIFDAFSSTPINYDAGTGWNLPLNIAALPVTLVKFTAELKDNVTELTWKTSSEQNNAYFTVERSQDGTNFYSVLKKNGAGNSQVENDYTAMDDAPLDGLSYYRLRQTDNNGKSETFNIVPINNTHMGEFAINSMNPTSFRDFTVLDYKMPADGNARMTVTTMNGKTMLDEQVQSQKGHNTHRIDKVADWLPGMYIASLSYNGKTVSTKMIKVN
jgi:hypothetical protein